MNGSLVKVAMGGAVDTGQFTNDLYLYSTNDTAAVVEADGYFDNEGIEPAATIIAMMDLDGTPGGKIYLASGSEDDITVTVFPAT